MSAWLTVAQVADEEGCSMRTILRWIEQEGFPAVRLPDGRLRIPADYADRMPTTRVVVPTPPRPRSGNPYPPPDPVIGLDAIGERDGWRCHICGRPVRRADASRDHLIPMSAGGAWEPENLALAHRRCNSRRGPGRLPAQLRLLP